MYQFDLESLGLAGAYLGTAVSIDNEQAELLSVISRVERVMAEKPNAVISLRADAQASLNSVIYIKDQMTLAGREVVMKIDRPAESS